MRIVACGHTMAHLPQSMHRSGSQTGSSAASLRFSSFVVPVGNVPSTGSADTGSTDTGSGDDSGDDGAFDPTAGSIREQLVQQFVALGLTQQESECIANGVDPTDADVLAGDQGADYVAFGQPGQPLNEEILDLVAWWRDLFVLPCLAYAGNAEEAAVLAEAGTDFIGVSDAVWQDPESPAAGARRLQAVIEKNRGR